MVYVFFKGLGRWLNNEGDELCDMGVDEVTDFYDACGVFQLHKDSETEYKYTKELPNIQILLPCKHEDDEFKRAIKIKGIIRDDFNLPMFIKTEEQKKYFYFEIAPYNKNILKIIDSDLDNAEQEIKETSGDNLDQLSETERKTLLKIIGLLSMVLSKKSNNLVKSSGNINISQVSEMLIKEIGTSGYEETKGLSQSNIRAIIANSLSLLNK